MEKVAILGGSGYSGGDLLRLLLNHAEVEDLIKAKEACAYLKVSKVTIYKWLKQGKITGYYLGTRLFFKMSELEQALKKKGGV